MAQQNSPHVLLFPYPAQGHINPLIQFAKRLNSKSVKTTLITTIYTSNSIRSQNTSATSIDILSVSDGFDEGGYASADSSESYLDTFREVGSKSLLNLLKKLQSEGEKIDAVIYDAFIPWVLDVVLEAGIKGGAFFTQACGVNNIYYHVYKGYISLPLSSSTVTVPGLPTLENWETPSFVHNYGPYPGWTKTVFNQFVNIDKATWVFTNTFYELEEKDFAKQDFEDDKKKEVAIDLNQDFEFDNITLPDNEDPKNEMNGSSERKRKREANLVAMKSHQVIDVKDSDDEKDDVGGDMSLNDVKMIENDTPNTNKQDDFDWDPFFDDDDDDIPFIKRRNKNRVKLETNMFRLIDEDLTDKD